MRARASHAGSASVSGEPADSFVDESGLRPSLRGVRPRSDVDRRQLNGTEKPVVRDVAPLRVMHVHGMTSEQGFKMLPLLLSLASTRKQLLQ